MMFRIVPRGQHEQAQTSALIGLCLRVLINKTHEKCFCQDSGNLQIKGTTTNSDGNTDIKTKYIDYTCLPRRQTSEKTANSDITNSENENGKKDVTEAYQDDHVDKRSVLRFLRKLNVNRETLKKKLNGLGLKDDLSEEAFRAFRRNIWKELEEDENLRHFLENFKSDEACIDDMFEVLYNYTKQRYPVTETSAELNMLGDLKSPANWFFTARGIKRNIIFHAGPTNSGKTHNALESFEKSPSGIYGGPLRMLAAEVFERTNANGVLCDMITGEQKLWARSQSEPSEHVACTIEMCKNTHPYDCAVIDEIQLLRDKDRGWGWTSAFLGIPAKEIHLCGEPAAEKLIRSLVKSTGDKLEVRRYERLTPLHVMKQSIGSLKAVRPGDCVVAFSRVKIFEIRAEIERLTGLTCSVIYGGLPPSIRLEQARRFNDPNEMDKVLVASDAIGMGINLSIRRLIFSSLRKFDGQTQITLPSYHAKQIAGRAGRHGTKYPQGYVTTLHDKDLPLLRHLFFSPTEDVEKAGLHPTYEQIEMFSHVLPKATLSELFDTFVQFAKLDGNYFMCDIEHLKRVAEAIESIPLTLKQRHALCSAASDRTNRSSFVINIAVKVAQLFSDGVEIDVEEIKKIVGWPPKKARSLDDLSQLESIHDVFDMYLWMSYRYEETFVDRDKVRELQEEIEKLIKIGVDRVARNNNKMNKYCGYCNTSFMKNNFKRKKKNRDSFS